MRPVSRNVKLTGLVLAIFIVALGVGLTLTQMKEARQDEERRVLIEKTARESVERALAPEQPKQ